MMSTLTFVILECLKQPCCKYFTIIFETVQLNCITVYETTSLSLRSHSFAICSLSQISASLRDGDNTAAQGNRLTSHPSQQPVIQEPLPSSYRTSVRSTQKQSSTTEISAVPRENIVLIARAPSDFATKMRRVKHSYLSNLPA